MNWQPIETCPKAKDAEYVVGYDSATVWIVRGAWHRSVEECIELKSYGCDFDESDAGWWSYRNSVTQEMITPTHWLCEVGETPDV